MRETVPRQREQREQRTPKRTPQSVPQPPPLEAKTLDETMRIAQSLCASPLEHKFIRVPDFMSCDMYDYQLEALNWLVRMHENRVNGVFADEMGAGKTRVAVAMIGYLRKEDATKPVIVVMPQVVIPFWQKEFENTCNFKVLVLTGGKGKRSEVKEQMKKRKFDVSLTSYPNMRNESKIMNSVLYQTRYSYMVCDEGHVLKNRTTKATSTLAKVKCSAKLIITGTPIQVMNA